MQEAFGTLRPIEISACAACNLFWFDRLESLRLNAQALGLNDDQYASVARDMGYAWALAVRRALSLADVQSYEAQAAAAVISGAIERSAADAAETAEQGDDKDDQDDGAD